MNPNLCNNCGGAYEYRHGRWVCRSCGALKPEAISNEEVTLLYTAYQKLRLADFSEAELEFDDIIRKYPENPNGYWGRLMAKYGIKYEEDFDGRMIPTCYATSIESVLSSPDYQKALQYADEESRAYYEAQAEYIERVRKEWVEKAKKEKPYDIFICYKDSDLANGIERTQDSIAAQELYVHLTNKGYRVFYSHDSLRDKAGEKYEPYIFNALATSKVMIVYGSKPEYITSTWLKNEWTRYEKRIQKGEKKPNSLLVAYDGFSPSELPTALSSMQCLNAADKSFYGDLDDTVERILYGETVAEKYEKKKKSKAPLIVTIFLLLAMLGGVLAWSMMGNSTVTSVNNAAQNATVVSNGGTFPKDTEFRVNEVLNDEKLESMAQTLSVNQETYRFYDMELWSGGSVYDASGNVTVTLPLPAEISEEDAVVYYMSGNTPRKISSQVDEGKISFVTNHFSVYMIAEAITSCNHVSVTDPAVPATCTENGLTEGAHCSLCKEVLVEQEVVLAAHKPGPAADCTNAQHCTVCRTELSPELGHTPGKEATCTTAQTCTVCRVELTPAGHKPGEAATCTTAQYCTVCDVEMKAALGHKPGKAATCAQAQICTVCEEELAPATGHNYKSETTEPTCTEKGYTTYICVDCDDTYASDYVSATGHSFGEWYETKEPTESEAGEKRRDCENCDEYETSPIAALNHDHSDWDVIILEAVDPTCTETGLTEGEKCSGCEEITVPQEIVPATGHDYESEVTEPTCTEKGYTTYTCVDCDDTYVSGYVNATGHSFGEWYETKEPTESEPGEKCRDCENCDEFETSPVAALGHDHDNWEVIILEAVEPTCTETGLTEGEKCSGCGEITVPQEIVPATGHDYYSEVTEPTCLEDGYTEYICNNCEYSHITDFVPALGHTPDIDALCAEERYCTVCEEYLEAEADHEYEEEYIEDPDYAEGGYTVYTCVNCGDSYDDYHDYGESERVDPTCTEDGYVIYVCYDCEHEYTAVLSALDPENGHQYEQDEDGYYEGPTCEDGGYLSYICTNCGDSYDEYVEATGHNYDDGEVTEPTCEEEGYTTYTCLNCDDWYDDDYVDALGHDYDDGLVTEPTCEEEGYTTYTCLNCDDCYDDDYVDAIGHDYEAEVTEPTCEEEGYTTYTCLNCDDCYDDDYVDMIAHTLDINASCSICGEAIEAVVGKTVMFGSYEQDNDTTNGKEAIEWLVLDVQDGKALVISKYALDCKQYNTSYASVTWETCSLRAWLNDDFLNSTFTSDEKLLIPMVMVPADANPSYDTDSGNGTEDQIFLLSIEEANKYFDSNDERTCEATNYAEEQGVWVNNLDGNCWWWLRSPGINRNYAAGIGTDGDVDVHGVCVHSDGEEDDTSDYNNEDDIAVRPAMWIDLNP